MRLNQESSKEERLQTPHRRTLLAAVAGAATGLAGCAEYFEDVNTENGEEGTTEDENGGEGTVGDESNGENLDSDQDSDNADDQDGTNEEDEQFKWGELTDLEMRERLIGFQPSSTELDYLDRGFNFSIDNERRIRELLSDDSYGERERLYDLEGGMSNILPLKEVEAVVSSDRLANTYVVPGAEKYIDDFEERMEKNELVDGDSFTTYQGELEALDHLENEEVDVEMLVTVFPEENLILEAYVERPEGGEPFEPAYPRMEGNIKGILGDIKTVDTDISEYFEQEFYEEDVLVDRIGGISLVHSTKLDMEDEMLRPTSSTSHVDPERGSSDHEGYAIFPVIYDSENQEIVEKAQGYFGEGEELVTDEEVRWKDFDIIEKPGYYRME